LPSFETIIPSFIVLVLSLSFHEAAHAWTADRLGDSTARRLGRITLNPLSHIDWIGTVLFPLVAMMSGFPLIGWAKPVPVMGANLRSPRRDFAIVAAAGPLSNLLLAVVAAMILGVLETGQMTSLPVPVLRFVLVCVTLNVLLAVFNLLPVPPLDGSNVLAGLVPEQFARVIDAMRPYSWVILYALMLSGALWTVVSPIYRVLLSLLLQ
jgi:Zn-dependent protease